MKRFLILLSFCVAIAGCSKDSNPVAQEEGNSEPGAYGMELYASAVRLMRDSSEQYADSLGLEPDTGPLVFLYLYEEPLPTERY